MSIGKNSVGNRLTDFFYPGRQGGGKQRIRRARSLQPSAHIVYLSNPIPALALLLIHWQSNHTILVYQDQSFPQVTLTCFFLSFTTQIQN